MLDTNRQILEQIKKANNVLITFKKTWSGDAVASALALYLFLKKMGKNAEIAADRLEKDGAYGFLPEYAAIRHSLNNLRKFIVSIDITNAKVGQIKYKIEDNALDFIISPKSGFFTAENVKTRSGEFKYDLAIVLDTPDMESLGAIYDNDTEFFYQTPVINIDHHSNNENYGQINLVELTAIATAEILYGLLADLSPEHLDEDIATCLLTGIISKTRSFKTQNITPQALDAASRLVAMGARREEIVNYLYRSRPISTLKLWGRVLARLKSDLDDKLVWSVLALSDFEKTETAAGDLSEVIDELMINIPRARIIVLMYETGNSGASASEALVYSTKAVDSLDLVKAYRPAGTKQLAKVRLDMPLAAAETALIGAVKDKLAKLPL